MTQRDEMLAADASIAAENARSAARIRDVLVIAIEAIEAGKIVGGVRLMRTVARHLQADATLKAALASMMRPT